MSNSFLVILFHGSGSFPSSSFPGVALVQGFNFEAEE